MMNTTADRFERFHRQFILQIRLIDWDKVSLSLIKSGLPLNVQFELKLLEQKNANLDKSKKFEGDYAIVCDNIAGNWM